MKKTQRGMSIFGILIVLAIVAGAGYYLYKTIMEIDTGPGCKDDFTSCMRYCRRTMIDDTSLQKCQQNCDRAADECNRRR